MELARGEGVSSENFARLKAAALQMDWPRDVDTGTEGFPYATSTIPPPA